MNSSLNRTQKIVNIFENFLESKLQENDIFLVILTKLKDNYYTNNQEKIFEIVCVDTIESRTKAFISLLIHYKIDKYKIKTIGNLDSYRSGSENNYQSGKTCYTLKIRSPVEEKTIDLNTSISLFLGRNLNKLKQDSSYVESQFLELDSYKKISSIHAKLCPVPYSNKSAWQIIDLKSTNGTYINGNKIEGPHLLKNNDLITLSYESPSSKTPEIRFIEPLNDTNNIKQTNEFLLFCLIINPKQGLSPVDKNNLEKIFALPNYTCLIIADSSLLSANEIVLSKKKLSNINKWIKSIYPQAKFNIVNLDLSPFSNELKKNKISPSLQKKYNIFIDNIQKVSTKIPSSQVPNDLEIISAKYIPFLKNYYSSQLQSVEKNIERTHSMIDGYSLEELSWKKQTEFRNTREYRDLSIQDIRDDFSRYWSAILSDNRPESLPRKLKLFVNNLDVLIYKESKETRIKLYSESEQDIHKYILEFCQNELKLLAKNAWTQIAYHLNNGGLRKVSVECFERLRIISSLKMSDSFTSNFPFPSYHRALNNEYLDMQDSVATLDNSNGYNFAQLALEGGVAVGLAFLNPTTATIRGVSFAMNLINRPLNQASLRKQKYGPIGDSLKQRTWQYYRGIIRSIAEEIQIDIRKSLSYETRQISKGIDQMEEQISLYVHQVQNGLKGYQQQKDKILRNYSELEKIYNLIIKSE